MLTLCPGVAFAAEVPLDPQPGLPFRDHERLT